MPQLAPLSWFLLPVFFFSVVFVLFVCFWWEKSIMLGKVFCKSSVSKSFMVWSW